MYTINTIPHVKCFVRYLPTRCFCIRNLTRSLRSLVRFLIQKQLVCKYRTPALSMKYSLSPLYWQKKKQQQQPCTCAAHFFVHLFDHGVKLPNSFYVGKCRMCSPMFCRVPVHFFYYTAAHFHLVGCFFSFSHFLTANFYVFPPTKFVCCFLSNALTFLSTSLKTSKFSRT